MADAWKQRCALRGRRIELETGQRKMTGICREIDADGALVVQTVDNVERFFGGVVAGNRESER